MTESEVVRQMRRSFDRLWKERDFEGAMAGIHPDLEWEVPGPNSSRVRGPEAVAAYFRNFLEVWEEFEEEYDFIEIGDGRIVALITYSARGKASGIPIEGEMGQIWTLRDGMAVGMQAFETHAEALAAAGIEREERDERAVVQ